MNQIVRQRPEGGRPPSLPLDKNLSWMYPLFIPGCYGTRMTGAGFGGCTINLVARDDAPQFSYRLMADYFDQTGYKGATITSSPAQGAGRIF